MPREVASGVPRPVQHMPALTGLRFVLAIWVILHHLSGKGKMLEGALAALPGPLYTLIHSGYIAVGTFFVLSGFVLARSYGATEWNRRNLLRYSVARWARVYPVYLLSLVILAPIIYSELSSGRPAITDERASLLVNYGFVLQGWTGTLPVHWNTPAWSLSCEMFFYICFPLAVCVLRGVAWHRVLIPAGIALALPTVLAGFHVPIDWKPIIHLGDFLIGIAAAGAYAALEHRDSPLMGRGYWLYAPAALLGIAIIAFPILVPGPMFVSSALRPLNAMLITGLALGGGFPARALSTPAVTFLGQASYSMYILHIPLLWWFKRTWVYQASVMPQFAAALIYVGGVVTVSGLVFRHFEEPANRRIRRLFAGAR